MNTGPFQGLRIGSDEGLQSWIYLLHGKSAFEYGPEQHNKISYNQTWYFIIICSILFLGRQYGFGTGDYSVE